MDVHAHLEALLDLAEEVGIVIRRAPAAGEGGEHPGGALVRLQGREILFLDPTASPSEQVAVAAAALHGRPELDNRFLRPEIRRLIDEAAPGN